MEYAEANSLQFFQQGKSAINAVTCACYRSGIGCTSKPARIDVPRLFFVGERAAGIRRVVGRAVVSGMQDAPRHFRIPAGVLGLGELVGDRRDSLKDAMRDELALGVSGLRHAEVVGHLASQ